MTRINLLPPEIQAKRQSERRMVFVILGALALAVVLAGVWIYGYFGNQNRKADLATIEQQVRQTQAEAQKLAIFEQTAAELESRSATVDRALAGRLDWARLFDELSLVLPSDLWVENMSSDEIDGLSIQGWAVDAPNDTPDAGHKSIAKMLVRLADLEQLQDVWLTNSVKALFQEQDAIQFTVTAGVKDLSAETSGTAESSGQ